MKNNFKTPELEIVFLNVTDIVYTSGLEDDLTGAFDDAEQM